MKLEVCVDTILSARRAAEGGADRIELCSSLKHGGLTPSPGVVATINEIFKGKRGEKPTRCSIFVMVRPRPGDFTYSEEEVVSMCSDIDYAASLGADGVVFGALTRGGKVDEGVTARLVAKCKEHSLGMTFHRAIDLVHDWREALTLLSKLGVDRVLTAGQESSAFVGLRTVVEMVRFVRENDLGMTVMAGAGINAKNVLEFLQTAEEGCELGSLVDIHGSFKETVDSEANYSWRADPNRDFGSHWVSGSSQIKSAKQIMESFCKNIKTRDPIPRK
ncbi:copper homeostasis protein CutC [Chloropicon primus]|uniref:Copper homeostasis protein cutC homolog n=1 Tax=Chloropicon primus TaxID=1764295 RepID=A0A5B8ME19_9CHLO|nr:copper homeostasis protein CutC [Chloropicon primus]UPQ98043.1 copper homeostasis protein CutC [Chloropicon primus]|eukprot:QDZ18836.1 copper homeostasis protein CutC [Chloropicon primus]